MSEAYELSSYPACIRDFATYKLGIQGCSKKTVEEYLLDLRMFTRFIYSNRNGLPTDDESMEKLDISSVDDGFFAGITTEEIYDYMYFLKNVRNNTPTSRARKLSAIKSFYKCMTVKYHKFDENPAINIEGPKKKPSLPKFLSLDESLTLLQTVRDDTSNPYRERDFAILVLFLNCGMRLSELAGINLTDIDDDLRSLRVIGKGSKERIIYLNEACREAIVAYLPHRLKNCPESRRENALFLSRLGKRISVKTVQHLVKKHLYEAGLGNRNYSTHKLRHTAATLMYQTGNVDIRVLKDILGHEQLTTTQIYTHVSSEGMERAMTQNPLSNVSPPESDELKAILSGDDEPDETD